MAMWELEFFVKDNGRCPAFDFVQVQEPQEQVLIRRAFDLLAELGNQLRRPQVDMLTDGLYELRIRVIKKRYRFIYFFHGRHMIVVTHGLLKKESAVAKDEIDKAKDYRAIYLKRMEQK
jgi:phage-related protein